MHFFTHLCLRRSSSVFGLRWPLPPVWPFTPPALLLRLPLRLLDPSSSDESSSVSVSLSPPLLLLPLSASAAPASHKSDRQGVTSAVVLTHLRGRQAIA